MSEDFFDRLDRYMAHSGLNDNKLTVVASLSIGALGKQRRGSRGLGGDSIAKILYACPDLNADWLLTGRGSMLIQSSELSANTSTPSPLNADRESFYRELLSEKDRKNAQLNRENGALEARLEQSEKEISRLRRLVRPADRSLEDAVLAEIFGFNDEESETVINPPESAPIHPKDGTSRKHKSSHDPHDN